MEILITVFGVILLIIAVIIYTTLVSGLVFYKFWGWFVLSVFPELPELTFSAAVGLALFTTLLKATVVTDTKKEDQNNTHVITGLISPWLILLIGWCVHLYIG